MSIEIVSDDLPDDIDELIAEYQDLKAKNAELLVEVTQLRQKERPFIFSEYEAWRATFQNDEQAARAGFNDAMKHWNEAYKLQGNDEPAGYWAGRLADQIEAFLGINVGDRSNELDRWSNAFEAMEVLYKEMAIDVVMGLNQNTSKMVHRFAHALKLKLLSAQQKYGYTDQWATDDWEEKCREDLLNHLFKGDPLDVAAYAAFCWARKWSTTPTNLPSTVSAKWRSEGKPDPLGNVYECERSFLCLGYMTDDELANAVFLHDHKNFDIRAVAKGDPSSIALLTGAKERIRWLSRKLFDQQPPESWHLVPSKPNDDQVIHGAEILHDAGIRFEDELNTTKLMQDLYLNIYESLLNSAPKKDS
jgi:hypothetical protein